MDIKKIRCLDGFEFEDYTRDQLSNLGFKVKHTPKSGDFGIDLIVDDYGIQLKNYSSSIGVTAVQEVYTGASYYKKKPVLLVTNYYTKPAIHLAESLNIELIDLDDLLNWGNPYYNRSFNHKKGFYESVRLNLSYGLKSKGEVSLYGREKKL